MSKDRQAFPACLQEIATALDSRDAGIWGLMEVEGPASLPSLLAGSDSWGGCTRNQQGRDRGPHGGWRTSMSKDRQAFPACLQEIATTLESQRGWDLGAHGGSGTSMAMDRPAFPTQSWLGAALDAGTGGLG